MFVMMCCVDLNVVIVCNVVRYIYLTVDCRKFTNLCYASYCMALGDAITDWWITDYCALVYVFMLVLFCCLRLVYSLSVSHVKS